jgi:hypothetical protein
MTKLRSRLGRLGTGVAVVALAVPAMALGTSGDAHAGVFDGPDGQIQCSGDLCVQTNSVDTTGCTATIAAWANTSDFFGHFEMAIPDTGYVANSNTQTWPAGGEDYKFQVHFNPDVTYEATAWGYNGGQYENLGQVDFTINDASGC